MSNASGDVVTFDTAGVYKGNPLPSLPIGRSILTKNSGFSRRCINGYTAWRAEDGNGICNYMFGKLREIDGEFMASFLDGIYRLAATPLLLSSKNRTLSSELDS
jgi:hypothetical protein